MKTSKALLMPWTKFAPLVMLSAEMPRIFQKTVSITLALLACSSICAQAVSEYEIYPRPQKVEYAQKNLKISPKVNIVYEAGVDVYTRARLEQILQKSEIQFSKSEATAPSHTNILIGISQSGGVVDAYFKQNVPHEKSFFEKYDAHIVSVKDDTIAVLGADPDSAFYGVTTLKHVFNQLSEGQIKEFRIDDFSNVKHRGFIEGYYGNPWSNEDRAELMKFGGDYKLNTYFFAPKDDVYHNSKWRELYPAKELAEIKKLAQVGNETKNKYVYALHTFMHQPVRFDTKANYQNDLNIIKAKFTQLLENDVRAFSILADDAGVPPQGPESYVTLLEDLTNWLIQQKKTYPDLVTDIPFCPNDYMGNGSSPQLRTVNHAPDSVSIIMTGGRIWGEVSEDFTSNFKKNVASSGHEGRPPYLWINWPCSDNSKQHLIMGGNDTFLHPGVTPTGIRGIILNPMQQAEANKSALFAIADYGWNVWENKAQADQNWHDSFKYMDHGTAEETKASTALRTISRHMINQDMDGRVRALQESVELAPKLDNLKNKLNAGSVTKQDTAALIKEFEALRDAAAYYAENPGNPRTKGQIIYWLNCWEDTTTAAINYLKCLDAAADGDNNAIWDHYSTAQAAFAKSKTYEFKYVNHFEHAEVGVQHIVPFIKALGQHLSPIVTGIIDPSQAGGKNSQQPLTVTAGHSTNIGLRGGDLPTIIDGIERSNVSFALNPYDGPKRDGIPADAYVEVKLQQPQKIGAITFIQGEGDKINQAALEYTTDGRTWKTLTTFKDAKPTLQFDASQADVTAKSVRIRNLEATSKWWAVHEFAIAPQAKGAGYVYTNTKNDLTAEVKLDQAKLLPAKGVKLAPTEYIGLKLDRIKDLKSIDLDASTKLLTLQVSANAVEWQPVTRGKLPAARYVRLINQTNRAGTFEIKKFEVNSNEIQPLRYVKGHAKTYNDSKPEQAFDGDFNTTVFFDKGFDSGDSIVYDFGQVIQVNNLKYVVLDTDTDHIRDAKFQLSLDGKTWKDAFSATKSSDDRDAKPQDNGYKHGSLSNGVIPISHSYLEGANLNTKARYFRILATSSYTTRWIRISEILINDGQYIPSINNPTFVSTPIELKGHEPEKMIDHDLTTSYRPNTNDGKITSGSIIYKLSENTQLQKINIVQDGNAISNAKVVVRTEQEGWKPLGILDKSLNELKNSEYKHIFEIGIQWSGTPPTIYEIVPLPKQ